MDSSHDQNVMGLLRRMSYVLEPEIAEGRWLVTGNLPVSALAVTGSFLIGQGTMGEALVVS